MFTGNTRRSCEPRLCGEIKCTYLYFSPWVVLYKVSPCDRYYVFIDRIFHPRHENWLHSLIARILLHQLPVLNVLDKPEAFFVKYQQKKIMKSNRILQKNGAKHTQGCSIRILSTSMSLCPWYNTLQRGIFEKWYNRHRRARSKMIFVTSDTSEY